METASYPRDTFFKQVLLSVTLFIKEEVDGTISAGECIAELNSETIYRKVIMYAQLLNSYVQQRSIQDLGLSITHTYIRVFIVVINMNRHVCTWAYVNPWFYLVRFHNRRLGRRSRRDDRKAARQYLHIEAQSMEKVTLGSLTKFSTPCMQKSGRLYY